MAVAGDALRLARLESEALADEGRQLDAERSGLVSSNGDDPDTVRIRIKLLQVIPYFCISLPDLKYGCLSGTVQKRDNVPSHGDKVDLLLGRKRQKWRRGCGGPVQVHREGEVLHGEITIQPGGSCGRHQGKRGRFGGEGRILTGTIIWIDKVRRENITKRDTPQHFRRWRFCNPSCRRCS